MNFRIHVSVDLFFKVGHFGLWLSGILMIKHTLTFSIESHLLKHNRKDTCVAGYSRRRRSVAAVPLAISRNEPIGPMIVCHLERLAAARWHDIQFAAVL